MKGRGQAKWESGAVKKQFEFYYIQYSKSYPSLTVKCLVLPEEANDKRVEWKSSNEKYAYVSKVDDTTARLEVIDGGIENPVEVLLQRLRWMAAISRI